MVKEKKSKAIIEIYELNEKLKVAQKELETLRGERDSLAAWKEVARPLLQDLLASCPHCGQKMLTLDWNGNVCILVCHNSHCGKYHTPIKNIKKADLRLLGVEIKNNSKK
jgi:RNA polymerase subunit RPABC4/transcription elongation factor Spt4